MARELRQTDHGNAPIAGANLLCVGARDQGWSSRPNPIGKSNVIATSPPPSPADAPTLIGYAVSGTVRESDAIRSIGTARVVLVAGRRGCRLAAARAAALPARPRPGA